MFVPIIEANYLLNDYKKFDMNNLLGANMSVGKANITIMATLDSCHNKLFGRPTPTEVNRSPVEGKCILVSGHDLMVLKKLLEQTEGKGLNIYTHGEMLPGTYYLNISI
jgi:hydroxylamine reductase